MTLIIPPGFKNKLDDDQFKAVTHLNGPVLVNASAGSGKTGSYAHRIVLLVANGVKEENIFASTFTKKAAEEMKERIRTVAKANNVEIDVNKLWIGTFHSLGIKACREYCHTIGYKPNFTIDDDDDQEYAIKRLLFDHPSFKGTKEAKPRDVLSAISYARNADESYLDVFERRLTNTSKHVALVDIAQKYEEQKRERNVFDFDDMMIYWLEILKKNSIARNFYQDKFHYVLVDEYQDCNNIQNEIIDILAAKNRNIFAVGDDFQVLYSFRAANIQSILNFNVRYPDVKIFNLENNYRSTPEIVAMANSSIINNTKQLEKRAISKGKSGPLPKLIVTMDERHQNDAIVKAIKNLKSKGVNYSQIAVLYRNNAMSVSLEQALNAALIPYVKKGGQFWKQAHLTLAIAWLKLLQNPSDPTVMAKCLQTYDGIGAKAISNFTEVIKSEEDLIDFMDGRITINEKKSELYEPFRNHLCDLEGILAEAESPLNECMLYLVDMLEPYILKEYGSTTDRKKQREAEERLDDYDVLVNLSQQFESIKDLLEAISLQDDRKSEKDRDEVTLATGHGAKGLEWDVVFMIGLVKDSFPSQYCSSLEEIEEERRIFYVMATRAKNRLIMMYPRNIKRYGESQPTAISPFVLELDEDTYEIKEL